MNKISHHRKPAESRKLRVRGKMNGTAERPRLSVHRTNRFIYLQVINDDQAKTIVAQSDRQVRLGLKKGESLTKTASAVLATEALAEQLKKLKVTALVFDRGALRYYGRVKTVAETLRNQGINL